MRKIKTLFLLAGLCLTGSAFAAKDQVIQLLNAVSPLKTMAISYKICNPKTCTKSATIDILGSSVKPIINPFPNDRTVYITIENVIERDENGNEVARNNSGCEATTFSTDYFPVLVFNDYGTNLVVCQKGLQ